MRRKHLLFPFFIIVFVFITGVSFALNGYFGGGSRDIFSDTATRGLVGYWNFEEGTGQTVNDSSDQNNDGTLGADSSASTDDPAWRASKAGLGGALNFDDDGTGDVVNYGDNSTLETITQGDHTISFWFLHTHTDGMNTGHFLSKGDGVEWWAAEAISTGAVSFSWDDDILKVAITSSAIYNDGNWHHLTAVRDGSTYYMYIDGTQVGSASVSTSFTVPESMKSGNAQWSSDEQLDGSLDDLRVYSRALSASEVRYLYNHGGPVAHYKFDEGSGTTAYEATNTIGDGTITEATYTAGKFGTALNLDGSNDVITVANANAIDFDIGLKNAVTFSSWINADTAGEASVGQILYKGTNTWVRVDTLSSGKLDLEASMDLATADATLNVSSIVTVGQWHHVVMKYEDDSDDEIELFVDGILVGTSTDGSGAPATEDNSLLIGGTTGNNFDGKIDDFRVYPYGRTVQDIQLDYNAGFAAKFGPSADSNSLSPAKTVANGLVGYWNFEEGTGQTVNDSSDQNNDGTLGANSSASTNDPAWTASKAGLGGALSFDGGDYVNLGNVDVQGSLTLAVWIKRLDTNGGYVMVKYGVCGGCGQYGFYLRGVSGDVLEFSVQAFGGNITKSINLNEWVFAVGTFDGTTSRLYINGVEVDSAAETQTTNSRNFLIGGRDEGGGTVGVFSTVQVDDLRVYSRALSASEVRYLYNHGGPVAHYKFDEGSGTTAYEATNTIGDGTITEATYTAGKFGTALNLDGSNDVITVANANAIDFDIGLKNAVTFSSWINADTAGEASAGQILYKGTNTWVRVDTLSSGKLDLEASMDLATADATLNVSSIITVGQWHHVVMKYEDDADDEIELFVDGILVGTSTDGSGAPATEDNSLLIGGTTGNNFDGKIDDFRVYSYGRDAREIQADYNGGTAARFR